MRFVYKVNIVFKCASLKHNTHPVVIDDEGKKEG